MKWPLLFNRGHLCRTFLFQLECSAPALTASSHNVALQNVFIATALQPDSSPHHNVFWEKTKAGKSFKRWTIGGENCWRCLGKINVQMRWWNKKSSCVHKPFQKFLIMFFLVAVSVLFEKRRKCNLFKWLSPFFLSVAKGSWLRRDVILAADDSSYLIFPLYVLTWRCKLHLKDLKTLLAVFKVLLWCAALRTLTPFVLFSLLSLLPKLIVWMLDREAAH